MNLLRISVSLSLFLVLNAQASLIQDRVAHILPGNLKSDETLVLLAQSGRVLVVNNQKVLHQLNKAIKTNSMISFVEENDQILTLANNEESFSSVLDPYFDRSLPSFSVEDQSTTIRYTDANYIPTNLKTLADAQKLMRPLKDNELSKSECFQRAHLWSIEMNQMAQVRSEKVFLFFTEKYMREYRFRWWFHVAPFVLVNGEEMVIDPRFFAKPADMQSWSNFFMPSHPLCKTAANYQEYESHGEDEYCFYRKLPMYYFEPTEVEARDKYKSVITDWIDEQVSSAYASLLNAPWWRR